MQEATGRTGAGSLHAVVVVPCLDEETNVERVGRSLGFGVGSGSGPATLVLVDNGSTDGTAPAMSGLAARSGPGKVVVISEPERGFVPARHSGALAARRIARCRKLDENRVLLVQADADTFYWPGYVETLLEASARAGEGVLVEGVSEAPDVPGDWIPYYDLERAVDDAASAAFGDPEQDVVVDDKVAAFRLSDYFGWGGHRRERARDGDEVLSETTRLFIAAKLRGGVRRRACGAVAVTSQRRTLDDPATAFATAGFPRGPVWRRRVRLDPVSSPPGDMAALERLIPLRAAHLVGMFGLLPAWFSAHDGRLPTGTAALDAAYLRTLESSPTARVAADRPGKLLDWAMSRTPGEVARILEAAGCDMRPVRG